MMWTELHRNGARRRGPYNEVDMLVNEMQMSHFVDTTQGRLPGKPNDVTLPYRYTINVTPSAAYAVAKASIHHQASFGTCFSIT